MSSCWKVHSYEIFISLRTKMHDNQWLLGKYRDLISPFIKVKYLNQQLEYIVNWRLLRHCKSVITLEMNLNQPESLLKCLKITPLANYMSFSPIFYLDCIKLSIQVIIVLYPTAIEQKYL